MSLSSLAVKATQTLSNLFDHLERAGLDADCDDCSLTFNSLSDSPYLLNYHGVAQQIWLASPLTGAHHFQLQEGRWISTRGTEDLIFLLERELGISLS